MILLVPSRCALLEIPTMEVAAAVLIGSVVAWFVEQVSSDVK
jgi:hypothetical protein